MRSVLYLTLLCSGIFACSGEKKKQETGPNAKIELELVDSLVVDELSVLTMDDYSVENDAYLLKGNRSRKVYLVDGKGLITKEYGILDDGPNGVGSNGAFGYRFLDKDRWIAQGRFNGYHIYGIDGRKIKTVPPNNLDIYAITLYTARTTFNPYVKEGIAYIVGEEQNLYNHTEIDPKKTGAGFYDQARVIYQYNLDKEENVLLESYPENWEPRASQRFVGVSYPFVTYHKRKQEMALLPKAGNQLFVYDFSGQEPVLRYTVELTHRFRKDEAPNLDPAQDDHFLDYPAFSDVRYLGDRILVGFNTKIPLDIMNQLRAKSEQYYELPEYKEAVEQYVKPYYLVVENGRQIGQLGEFPVPGTLNFTDENGIIYINDNINPKVERDYNVFYKLKLKE